MKRYFEIARKIPNSPVEIAIAIVITALGSIAIRQALENNFFNNVQYKVL